MTDTNLNELDETIAETEAVLDDMDDDDDRATDAGERAGDRVKGGLASAVTRFISGFGRVVPFRSRLFKKLMLASSYRYFKLSGGDALALRARPNGKIEPHPVKWKDAAQSVEDVGNDGPDRPGWKLKGEERTFGPGAEGRNIDFFGKTPIILLDDDNPERWNTLDARVSECLEDPERVDALFETANVEVTGVIDQRAYDPDADPGANGEAVADGGVPVQDQYDVLFGNIARGRLKDKLIDPSSRPGDDGMRVSFRKVQEQRFERSTTEEMKNQEVRGFLAGKADEEHKDLVKRLALYFIAGVVLVVAMFLFGPSVVGGAISGGGGGSMIPLMAGVFA